MINLGPGIYLDTETMQIIKLNGDGKRPSIFKTDGDISVLENLSGVKISVR